MKKQRKAWWGCWVLLAVLAGCTPPTNNDPPNLNGQIRGKSFTFQTGTVKQTATKYEIVLFSTNAVDGLTTYPNVSFSLDKAEPARTYDVSVNAPSPGGLKTILVTGWGSSTDTIGALFGSGTLTISSIDLTGRVIKGTFTNAATDEGSSLSGSFSVSIP